MNAANDTFSHLVGRLRDGDAQAWEEIQGQMQPGMAMVLKRALRTGTAGPALTRWLSQALRIVPNPADVDALAAMLSSGLTRQLRRAPEPTAETVLEGRGAYRVAHV